LAEDDDPTIYSSATVDDVNDDRNTVASSRLVELLQNAGKGVSPEDSQQRERGKVKDMAQAALIQSKVEKKEAVKGGKNKGKKRAS
jgi:hypothetical protein